MVNVARGLVPRWGRGVAWQNPLCQTTTRAFSYLGVPAPTGRPQWLADAHAALDAAVAAAYGWPAGISQDDALRELLALNLAGGR